MGGGLARSGGGPRHSVSGGDGNAAEERPEGIGLRIQSVTSLEYEAVSTQKTLRIFMRDSVALPAVSAHLNTKGPGQVSFIMIKDDGDREIEIELPNKYKISPEIAAAMKSAPGVLDVELV